VLVEYTGAVIKGVTATLAFAVGAHVAARAGWTMWPVIFVGYVAWLVAWLLLDRLV
jgi:hypothetical protein